MNWFWNIFKVKNRFSFVEEVRLGINGTEVVYYTNMNDWYVDKSVSRNKEQAWEFYQRCLERGGIEPIVKVLEERKL